MGLLVHNASELVAPRGRIVPGQAGQVTGGSSYELGSHMFEAVGMARTSNRGHYQAGHLIPSQMRNHDVLRTMGMDLDHFSNGMWLPNKSASTSVLSRHEGFHGLYNRFVRNQLDDIQGRVGLDDIDLLQREVRTLQTKLEKLHRTGIPLYEVNATRIRRRILQQNPNAFRNHETTMEAMQRSLDQL